MGLAPPFTRETAAANARKAVASREANRHARLMTLETAAKRPPIELEVHRLTKAMSEMAVTSQEYARLSGILDKLWSKAFPTQGAVKSRGNRDRSPAPQPVVESPELAKGDSEAASPT